MEAIFRPYIRQIKAHHIRHTQATNRVKDAHNLDLPATRRDILEIAMRSDLPQFSQLLQIMGYQRLALGSKLFSQLGGFALCEVSPALGFAELDAFVIRHVHAIEVWKELHMDWFNDANVGHQSRDSSGSVRASRKPKAENFISGFVVENDEVVCFDDVFRESSAQSSLPSSL